MVCVAPQLSSMVASVASTPPKRHMRLRRLAVNISEESLGGQSAITDACVSPPPEKRRRLTLLFKARNLSEEVDDLKKVQPVVETEKWESTSTAAPDSDGATPKTSTGTVTPESRLFDDDRTDAGSVVEEQEGEEEEERLEESEEDVDVSEEEDGNHQQHRLPAFAKSSSSMAMPSDFGERPELMALRACARARDHVRGARAAGSQTLSEEAFLRAQVVACYFVQVDASSSFAPLPQSAQDSADVALIAAKAAWQACTGLCLNGSSADLADEQASEAASSRFGSVPPRLPLDFLEGVVEGLVGRLPRSEAFRTQFAARRGEPPHAAARSLASDLLQVASQFVADSFLSAQVALVLEPRSVAAAAVALAASLELRRHRAEVPAQELFTFLAMEAGSVAQLRRAMSEIVEVFRMWKGLQNRCDGEQKVEKCNSGSGLGADAA